MSRGRVTRRTVLAGGAAIAWWPGVGASAAERAAHSADTNPGLRYYYPVPRDPGIVRTDVCVYGGTSAGVVAAVRAAQAGLTVALVVFGRHLGGVTAAGLGATDTGKIDAIGGLSREFYRRLGQHYGRDDAFAFEPHVTAAVFEQWVAEAGVQVFTEHRLASVRTVGERIHVLRTENAKVFMADMFIDASYEGDLLAAAGVSFTVGRESNDTYGETINGVQFRSGHQFLRQIDPYVVPGDPASGLLQGISNAEPGTPGEGDHRIQAYNFRLCLTRSPERRPFPRPAGYDPARYELLLRYIQAGVWDAMRLNSTMPNGKTDLNNHGAVSTDNIGRNYAWPEGDYATREAVFQDHVTYQQGLLWFLANDPRVPAEIRDEVNGWGLAPDEFPETGGWSHELYVREGRRMVSDYVITEHDCRWDRQAADPIALASYTMDSHNCARVVVDGFARNEGDVQVPPAGPYGVSYRSITPARGECANLLVTCAVSASHIAFGSVRMEPVFMAIGHAAAVAAHVALEQDCAVQDVAYAELRRRLRAEQAILTWPPGRGPLVVDGPTGFAAGESGELTTTYTNDEGVAVRDVEITIDVPGPWSVQPASPTGVEVLDPGASFEVTWTVTAGTPQNALDRSTLTAAVAFTLPDEPDPSSYTHEHPVAVSHPVQPPLSVAASTEAYFGQLGEQLAILSNGRDVWTGNDQYGAVFHPAAATSGVVAQVTLVEQEPSDPQARAGLVVRNDLTAAGGSGGYVMLVAKPENGLLLLWDADGNGLVESVERTVLNPTPYPVHLRLERSQSTFHASYSLDGVQWHDVGDADVPTVAEQQDVGVLCCSHADSVLGLAVFENLEITQS